MTPKSENIQIFIGKQYAGARANIQQKPYGASLIYCLSDLWCLYFGVTPAFSFNNGNRTEWSPIRFAIIWVINKIGRPRSGSPICSSRVWLQTELDITKSCYQLIKTVTKIEKETRPRLYVFIKKGTNSAICVTTARAHDAFCSLTKAWRVNCPFNCPIIQSTHKHNVYTVLLVLKSLSRIL